MAVKFGNFLTKKIKQGEQIMKSANSKLAIVLLMLLVTLGSLTMVTGCKKKSGAEKPAERSTSVEQQEENTGDEW